MASPAKLSAYKPTNREKLAALIAGDSEQGSLRRQVAKGLVGGLGGDEMGLLDFTPAALGFADEAARQAGTKGQRAQGLFALGTMLPIPGAAAVRGAAKGAKKGFGKVADDLAPITGYHGTSGDFSDFALPGRTGRATGGRKTGGNAVYIAESPETANSFARGEGANVRKVTASPGKIFDPTDPEHLAQLEPFVRKNFGTTVGRGALYGPDTAMQFLRDGDYGLLEQPAVEQWMKGRGFGAVRMQEKSGQNTWAVFDPQAIQPAPFGTAQTGLARVADDLAPKAKAPSRAPIEGKRGQAAAPDLRNLNTAAAIKTARKEPHLVQGSDKQFVGAPRGVTSKRQINANRRAFDADVAAGAPGADWYTRARQANVEVAGPDPARQQLFADEQALWSAQATPDTNLNFALQAHNAYEAGVPLEQARTGVQAATYRNARDAGERIPLGPKTGIYGQHLDPTAPHATTGTNDIWHARGFGFQGKDGQAFSRPLSSQEHKYLDYETMLAVDRANRGGLQGRTDWSAHEIQAAPWVAGKARGMEEARGMTPDQALAEASKTYPDYYDKYTAFGTHEAIPGQGTGHLEQLVDAPADVRQAYSQDPRSGWVGPDERDEIYASLGMYTRPTNQASGVYTNPQGVTEFNPAQVARPMVGMTPSDAGPVVDDASRAMLNAGEGFRAYMDAQNAGAWHKPVMNAPPGQMGSVFVPNEGPLSVEQIQGLQTAGGAHGIGDVVDTGQGATMTNFYPGPPTGAQTGKALKGDFGAELQQILPGAQPQRARVDSGYLDYESAWPQGEGSGAATRQLFEYLQSPNAPAVMERIDASPALRANVQGKIDRDIEWAAQTGHPLRQDLQTARQIFVERGLKGLKEALDSGVALPAVLLPILGYGLTAGQRPIQQPQGQPGA